MPRQTVKKRLSPNHGLYGWITVSDKGQIAIPAKARQELKIKTGDKLMVLRRQNKDGISLVKLDSISKRLRKLRD